MPSLDTNILVRYLVADDAKQHAVAKEFIESSHNPLFISLSVSVELEWVLRTRYSLGKKELLWIFSMLLETREIQFQEEASIERALSLYSDYNTDFADCLHVGIAMTHGQMPMATFDRKASRLHGALLLEV